VLSPDRYAMVLQIQRAMINVRFDVDEPPRALIGRNHLQR